MLRILEFMFSNGWRFTGCFIILILVFAVIEGAIANICTTIINSKKIKLMELQLEKDIIEKQNELKLDKK